jgi:hypothetical protein
MFHDVTESCRSSQASSHLALKIAPQLIGRGFIYQDRHFMEVTIELLFASPTCRNTKPVDDFRSMSRKTL